MVVVAKGLPCLWSDFGGWKARMVLMVEEVTLRC